MNKLATYVMIASTIMVLFYVMGVIPETSVAGSLLNMVQNPTKVTEWTAVIGNHKLFWVALGAAITSIIVASASSGVIGGVASTAFALFATFLAGLLLEALIKIYSAVISYSGGAGSLVSIVMLIIFAPFMMLFLFSIIEWARGIDNG